MVMAQTPSGVIKKATTAPKIDGTIETVWSTANVYNINKPFLSGGVADKPTLGADGKTTWKALWDAAGIYILVEVADDKFYPNYAVTPAGNNWEYDKPEIYFDVNYVLKDGLGSSGNKGHYQIAPGFTDGKNDGTLNGGGTAATAGWTYAFKVTGETYVGEYFVPFSMLVDKDGIEVDKLGNIGFDVTIIDRDAPEPARQRAVWANVGTINESYGNMDDCGKVTLQGAVANTFVDVITLTGGTTITTDNGKLQLAATIVPADATNKKLKWTLTNGSGKAKIDQTGLVTAIANGTVTVLAAATDGGWAESSLVTITISGQIIDKNDLWNSLNLIQNWNFDGPMVGGWPESWGGWLDGATQIAPVVANGVVTCTSAAAAENWHYQFNQSGFLAEPNVPYSFQFKAWSGATRVASVDFEDTSSNNYNRYGATSDPEANGRSEWKFTTTTKPTWFKFNVTFDQMVPTTVQKVQFMLSEAGGTISLDSILLIKSADFKTGIKPLSSNSMKVYPNPVGAGNELTVSLSVANAKVAIYNSIGQKLMEKVADGNIAKFNVSSLHKGMYFVQLSDGTVQKFIK